jgi:tricorn protease
MKRAVFTAFLAVLALQGQPPLLQHPTINRTHVVFAYAGDLWIAPRDGGDAKRLTSAPGMEMRPYFSPDGTQVAFSGQYDGNTDVFVVPAAGGVPKRLTWHPGADLVEGWTPDGKHVLFTSGRSSAMPAPRLFKAPLDGGLEEPLPLPSCDAGALSPDGSRLAYLPWSRADQIWKNYRGGRTTPIWIADLATSRIEKVPRDNSNDFSPMWIGDRIYFLSDRGGLASLYAYDTKSRRITQVVKAEGTPIKSATGGPDAIAYEQFGSLHLLDLKSGKPKKIEIRVAGDLLSVRPSWEKVAQNITWAGISPSGVRAVFAARGDIFTVPAEKGDIRNLTQTSGVHERFPAWSPDGKWIAYFSDESGEYELHIRDQAGKEPVRKYDLGKPASFYTGLVWSPDSKKIAYTDKRLNLWFLDLEKKTPVKVDTDTYDSPLKEMTPEFSPDSKWLAYAKELRNHLRAIHIYSVESGQTRQVTDGMSDARYPVWDKGGEYLYFAASTNAGTASGWLDMSSFAKPITRAAYLIVLKKDAASPFAPESDDEKVADEPAKADAAKPEAPKPDPAKPAAAKPAAKDVRIDFEGIDQRILALAAVPERNFVGLSAGKAGTLFLLEGPPVANIQGPGPGGSITLHRYDLKTKKLDRISEGLNGFTLSANGEKMLVRQGAAWFIRPAAGGPAPGANPATTAAVGGAPGGAAGAPLKVDQMEMLVNPREEWSQMFNEVWRVQRDYFYDPNLHGVSVDAAKKKYAPYLESVAHRADLNYLFAEMLSDISVGHMFVGGGALPQVKTVPGGLLGADYGIENGRYRFVRVYNGENWNPQLRAPLTQPGVNVTAGEYLLAVNGKELRATDNVHAFLEGTANKSVILRVGPDPSGANSREVTVVPVPSEQGLRTLAWIEDNRRKVDQATGGQVAYVYLPNTAGAGYVNFNRYFFAQIDKPAAIIDERFNGGGTAADYIVDYLRRDLRNYWSTREGEDFRTPVGAIPGPKAMLINEYAGSGGDAMPWYFRQSKVGPLIGTRTWGGLVGNVGAPQLIDGGTVSSPNLAFRNLQGALDVENIGVAPDIEVEFDPQAWRQGRDPQLEKAIEYVMAELKKNPPSKPKNGPFPNFWAK